MSPKLLPMMEPVEARQLLTMVWSQGMTGGITTKDNFTDYTMWFQPDVDRWCWDVGLETCMQDYSWLGEGFEPVTVRGAPAVKYTGVVPYVVDPAAQKKWSVEEFLAEYPHAFDRFPKDIIPQLDWFMVETDAKTGVKSLKAADFNFNYGPEEGQHGAIYGWDGGVLDESGSQPLKGKTEASQQVKHKKRSHRHHKAPVKKESVFLDRRLGAIGM